MTFAVRTASTALVTEEFTTRQVAFAVAAERTLALVRFLAKVAVQAGVAPHVYVVGGAVRNYLLGLAPKDVDLVVDSVALNGYTAEAFAARLCNEIPAETSLVVNQYGVAIVTIAGEWTVEGFGMKGEVVEIATARKEFYGGASGQGYKPHAVAPATIEEDLLRREFTCNTLLWRLAEVGTGDPARLALDLTGRGRAAVADRHLLTPRDPDLTFSDDPTRMLRAIKFHLKYGFTVPRETAEAILRNASKLKRMPADAVAKIFLKDILSHADVARALGCAASLGLTKVLREMMAEHAPFRAFITSEMRDRGVFAHLALAHHGLEADTPIKVFKVEERARIAEVVGYLAPESAEAFYAGLVKPRYEAEVLIERFKLEPKERRVFLPLARRLILESHSLSGSPTALTEQMALALASGDRP